MNRKSFIQKIMMAAIAAVIPKVFQSKVTQSSFFELTGSIPIENGKLVHGADIGFVRNVISKPIYCGGRPIDLNFFKEMFPEK